MSTADKLLIGAVVWLALVVFTCALHGLTEDPDQSPPRTPLYWSLVAWTYPAVAIAGTAACVLALVWQWGGA